MNNIFYYILFFITVMLYYISLNYIETETKRKDIFLTALKMYIIIPSSTLLCWLLTVKILLPLHIAPLYPFAAVLIFIAVAVFFETFVRITIGSSAAEYSISFLCILMAIQESTSLLDSLVASLVCITLFYAMPPLVHSFQKHIKISCLTKNFKNNSLVYIGIAVVIIAFLFWNVSWLNPEVLH